MDNIWQSQIVATKTLTENFTQIELMRPEGYHFTYGQYAQITPSQTGKAKYMAIASAPGDQNLQLLLTGKNPEWATADKVTLSSAQGGFAKVVALYRELLLITHGSGISAMLGLLKDQENGILEKKLTCLWGIRSPADLTILGAFGISGQNIHPVFSRSEGKLTGYVQQHLALFYQPGMSVLLVGSQEMTREVQSALQALGATSGDIYFNY